MPRAGEEWGDLTQRRRDAEECERFNASGISCYPVKKSRERQRRREAEEWETFNAEAQRRRAAEKMSDLSERIKGGGFAVTAEITPPCGPDPERIKGIASMLKGKVHGLVVEECFAGVHMSSLAAAVHLKTMGAAPVVTMLTRDANRIGLQSALLGVVSLGISDVLVLSGHHQALTSERQARGVYDVDSTQAIGVFRSMRDRIADWGLGNNAEAQRRKEENNFDGVTPPRAASKKAEITLGGAANPFAGPIPLRALRVAKKIKAGADFIVTQPVFDLPRFREWLDLLRGRGVPERVCLIAGIMWLASASQARELNETYRGMNIPEGVIHRLSQSADGEREGLLIAAEMVEQVRSLSGVRGIHLWARDREESLPELLDSAKL